MSIICQKIKFGYYGPFIKISHDGLNCSYFIELKNANVLQN